MRKAKMTTCACGCGTKLASEDKYGRARQFISGHNGRLYLGKESTKWGIQKRYRKNHPDKIRDGKRTYYRKRKLKAMVECGNECHFCNIEYDGTNAPIFEFHHINPQDKDIGITRIIANRTWIKVQQELSKCVLVCANCHNQHHGGEW